MKGNISEWKAISERLKYWNTEKARKIQSLESQKIVQWLIDLKLSRYQILELGCGSGYLGYLIISAFHESNRTFSYCFTDLLSECLNRARRNLKEYSNLPGIFFEKMDVFTIDKCLKPESQEIIISTGFAAAASYKQAVPKVAKILKPGGILICDFVNHFSLSIFLKEFPRSFRRMRSVRIDAQDPYSKLYHFGRKGIKEYFEKYDLELVKLAHVGWMRNPLLAMFKKLG